MAGHPNREVVRRLRIKLCYFVSQGDHNFWVCAKAKLHLLNQLAKVTVVARNWRTGVGHVGTGFVDVWDSFMPNLTEVWQCDAGDKRAAGQRVLRYRAQRRARGRER